MRRPSFALVCAISLACSGRDLRPASVHTPDRAREPGQPTNIVPRSSDTLVRDCLQKTGPFQVSEDSIGPLSLSLPLGTLKTTCLGAKDTVHDGENDEYPSLVWHFHGLNAVAYQFMDSLRPEFPADVWAVQGTNGLLFGRLPLTARWGEVHRAFGAGRGSGNNIEGDYNKITVMFCSHPRLFLEVEAPSDSLGGESWLSSDLSRIPSDAPILGVAFLSRPEPGWQCREP